MVPSRSDRRNVTTNQARGVSPVKSTPSGYPALLVPRHGGYGSQRKSTGHDSSQRISTGVVSSGGHGSSPRSSTSTRPVPTATVSRLQDSRQARVGAMKDVDVKRRSASGVPDAFDASCHYFQMLMELNLHRTIDPFQAFFGALTEPGREVNVRSAVLVFSDPLLFPTASTASEVQG